MECGAFANALIAPPFLEDGTYVHRLRVMLERESLGGPRDTGATRHPPDLPRLWLP